MLIACQRIYTLLSSSDSHFLLRRIVSSFIVISKLAARSRWNGAEVSELGASRLFKTGNNAVPNPSRVVLPVVCYLPRRLPLHIFLSIWDTFMSGKLFGETERNCLAVTSCFFAFARKNLSFEHFCWYFFPLDIAKIKLPLCIMSFDANKSACADNHFLRLTLWLWKPSWMSGAASEHHASADRCRS